MSITKILLISAMVPLMFVARACEQSEPDSLMKGDQKNTKKMKEHKFKIQKSEEEWRKVLGEQEYHILREKGTEPAFTGKLYDNKQNGIYLCAACSEPLFSSETKFESCTGWPSFYKPLADSAVVEESDDRYGMKRTEVRCAHCGGHLGHVFPDGPEPTGLRYCLNSAALDFEAE